MVRFYNNLQDRGDCQTTRKPYKPSHIVGWVVGWKVHRLWSSPAFAAQNPVSGQQKEVDSSVATTEFHRTNVEFGKHWSLSALA